MRHRLMVVVCLLAVAGFLAAPAQAQTLSAGIDVWTTPNDGSAYVDFSDNPIPAGYFCEGSQAFAQRIDLKGSPLVTSPSGVLGSTDTVVERAGAVDLSSGQGSTSIRVRAISFVNRSPISVPGCSSTFSAKVGLNGTAPTGSITIRGGSSGGTFDASFSVPGKITFTENTQPPRVLTTPVTETLGMQTVNASWADTVGTNGISYPSPVAIDTNGDGTADYQTPGTTSGFAAGWWRSSPTNPPIPVKVSHNGPHPTWPLPPPRTPTCSKAISTAIGAFEAQADAEESNTSAFTTDEEESLAVNVVSNVVSAGQTLTLIDSSDQLTPCIALVDGVTHLVSER